MVRKSSGSCGVDIKWVNVCRPGKCRYSLLLQKVFGSPNTEVNSEGFHLPVMAKWTISDNSPANHNYKLWTRYLKTDYLKVLKIYQNQQKLKRILALKEENHRKDSHSSVLSHRTRPGFSRSREQSSSRRHRYLRALSQRLNLGEPEMLKSRRKIPERKKRPGSHSECKIPSGRC